MTVANGSPYWLLIGGSWRHLEGVAPGVTPTPNRPTNLFTTLGNTVYAQVARVAKRSWDFAFQWEDAEAARWLDYAATNPGPVWLLDQNLATINMLTQAQTKGTAASISVDGVLMPTFAAGTSYSRKVRGGVAYHLSYTTFRTAGAVIGTYNAGAGSVNIVAPAGSGARRGSVSFTPAADGDVAITWTYAAVTTAARLTEGSLDTLGFLEGRSTPCRVLVSDGVPTFNMTFADKLAVGDSSYTVTEIG